MAGYKVEKEKIIKRFTFESLNKYPFPCILTESNDDNNFPVIELSEQTIRQIKIEQFGKVFTIPDINPKYTTKLIDIYTLKGINYNNSNKQHKVNTKNIHNYTNNITEWSVEQCKNILCPYKTTIDKKYNIPLFYLAHNEEICPFYHGNDRMIIPCDGIEKYELCPHYKILIKEGRAVVCKDNEKGLCKYKHIEGCPLDKKCTNKECSLYHQYCFMFKRPNFIMNIEDISKEEEKYIQGRLETFSEITKDYLDYCRRKGCILPENSNNDKYTREECYKILYNIIDNNLIKK